MMAIVGLASACDVLSPSRREFLIHVDSVAAPASVSPSASLQLLVFGPVGPDMCYRFKQFRVSRSAAGAEVSVAGEHVGGGDCALMPVYLQGQQLLIEPPFSDPFSVHFHQPDGSRLTSTIPMR
jgi:hypothetical protein